MKIRIFALFAALIMLAACGTDTASEVTPSESPEVSAAPSPSPTPAPTPTQSPSAEPELFVFTEENFPRLDGSTANIPLGQAVAAALLGKSFDECESYADFTKTTFSYYSLAREDSDLLLVYEPSPEVVQYLKESGDPIEMAPIGRDALVFLVNTQNPVSGLTTKQLQDIYSGEITNWKDAGGTDTEIKAFQRAQNSGSQTLMEKLVMRDIPLATPELTMVIGEMGGLVTAVASYDNASSGIGYNVYYYVSRMKTDPNIKLLAIDGTEPANESIKTGAYPFVNDFYAAIRKNEPEGSPARVLYEWLQSPTGKELIESAGYVPTE